MPRPRHPHHDALVARAAQLRREGATAREIAEELAVPARGQVIREATALVPPCERTGRMRAKDDLRIAAIQLRLQAKTYDEIQAELGVSKGSLSLWLSNLVLPEEVRAALLEQRGVRHAGRHGTFGRHQRALAEDQDAVATAEAWLGELTERELTIAAAVAYWCEGAKSKPWRGKRRVVFMNSDPVLIRLFLAGLRALGVHPHDLTFRLSIHEHADMTAAMAVWREVVGDAGARFHQPNLKRHNPSTVRRNVDHEYIGCLAVDVRRSAGLYRRIQGVVCAMVTGLPSSDGLQVDAMMPLASAIRRGVIGKPAGL